MKNDNKYANFNFAKDASTTEVVKGTGTWASGLDSTVSTLGDLAGSLFGKKPQQAQTQYTPPPKSNAPIVIGAIAGLLVIGGAIYYFNK